MPVIPPEILKILAIFANNLPALKIVAYIIALWAILSFARSVFLEVMGSFKRKQEDDKLLKLSDILDTAENVLNAQGQATTHITGWTRDIRSAADELKKAGFVNPLHLEALRVLRAGGVNDQLLKALLEFLADETTKNQIECQLAAADLLRGMTGINIRAAQSFTGIRAAKLSLEMESNLDDFMDKPFNYLKWVRFLLTGLRESDISIDASRSSISSQTIAGLYSFINWIAGTTNGPRINIRMREAFATRDLDLAGTLETHRKSGRAERLTIEPV